jgi:hypothetical protein
VGRQLLCGRHARSRAGELIDLYSAIFIPNEHGVGIPHVPDGFKPCHWRGNYWLPHGRPNIDKTVAEAAADYASTLAPDALACLDCESHAFAGIHYQDRTAAILSALAEFRKHSNARSIVIEWWPGMYEHLHAGRFTEAMEGARDGKTDEHDERRSRMFSLARAQRPIIEECGAVAWNCCKFQPTEDEQIRFALAGLKFLHEAYPGTYTVAWTCEGTPAVKEAIKGYDAVAVWGTLDQNRDWIETLRN